MKTGVIGCYRIGKKNLLYLGSEVLPGLGLEGEFLSARSLFKIFGKLVKRNEKLRKDFWTKLHR